MSKNLIMVDSAPQDKRSVTAMLRGYGDGREEAWLSYEAAHPEIHDHYYLIESYTYKTRRGLLPRLQTKPKSRYAILKRIALILSVIFLIF